MCCELFRQIEANRMSAAETILLAFIGFTCIAGLTWHFSSRHHEFRRGMRKMAGYTNWSSPLRK